MGNSLMTNNIYVMYCGHVICYVMLYIALIFKKYIFVFVFVFEYIFVFVFEGRRERENVVL